MAQNIREAAHEYWRQGLSIVLLKKKQPLHEWKQWQGKRQSESDFEALLWSEADGFALICGSKLDNGLFMAAIDFDVKNVSEEAQEKGRQALKHLPITSIEETPSGGQHWIYYTHNKPRTISAYHNECGIELLGEGKLCIMAPSAGYRRLNDNYPTTVQDLENLFYEALGKAGCNVERQAERGWFDSENSSSKHYKGGNPPCIKMLLRGTRVGQRNEFGIRLASYLLNFRGLSPEDAFKTLKRWNRLNEPILERKELEAIFKSALHNEYVYGCNDSILSSLCMKESCPLKSAVEPQLIFDEKVKTKAKQLLEDPAFFYKLGKVFEHGLKVSKINKLRFIIGEERNKRLLGLLLIGASKLGMTSIIKLLGDSGTAKDTMLRMWLELLPIKSMERSYLTAASLRYSREIQKMELLYIPDSPELHGEMGRQMRFMRADDGGLISEYATRDSATGDMVTRTVKLPVKAIATTSNAITADTALESGMWTLHTNSSEELTFKVKREKLRFRAGKRGLFPEEELRVWKCAFHILLTEDLPEELPKIPFAEALISLLESERSESRRDPDKLCDLIALIAWVRRFQKPTDNRGEADFIDMYYALQLGLDAITQTISDLDQRERAIYQSVEKAGVEQDVTCRYVAGETGIPYRTCFRYLEKMVEKGFLNKDKKQGRNTYTVFNEKTPKKLAISLDINVNDPKKLMGFILSSINDLPPCQNPSHTYFLVDPITGDSIFVEIRDNHPHIRVEKNSVTYPDGKVTSSEKSEETALNSEKSLKELIPVILARDLGFSENEDSNFVWRRVLPAEKCELCGRFAVEYEINHVREQQVLRRCQSCFDRMRQLFSKAAWKNIEDFEPQSQLQETKCPVKVG